MILYKSVVSNKIVHADGISDLVVFLNVDSSNLENNLDQRS